MIKKLCKNWLIDLKQSFMIWDSQVDRLCANKSNLYYEYDFKDYIETYEEFIAFQKKINENF